MWQPLPAQPRQHILRRQHAHAFTGGVGCTAEMGDNETVGEVDEGCSAEIGSGSVTSNAAAPICPICNAVTSASLSTTAPRAVLIKIAADSVVADYFEVGSSVE